ncbi:hypothetical protein BD289DRAFT_45813 [Coniella lustricola]|uniref:Secreted protein n=1 Tax=Coniella lustricola TaxID=2025994 RepID=A0A2T3A1E6_9PEZI|nr:hypothetical protein BD289DRAFT_45813 [Coniella lustricola]
MLLTLRFYPFPLGFCVVCACLSVENVQRLVALSKSCQNPLDHLQRFPHQCGFRLAKICVLCSPSIKLLKRGPSIPHRRTVLTHPSCLGPSQVQESL